MSVSLSISLPTLSVSVGVGVGVPNFPVISQVPMMFLKNV